MAWVDDEIILEVKPIRVRSFGRNFLMERVVRLWRGLARGGLEAPSMEMSKEKLDIGQILNLVTSEGFSNQAVAKVPNLGPTSEHR